MWGAPLISVGWPGQLRCPLALMVPSSWYEGWGGHTERISSEGPELGD